jgi:ParB-like chromosome segregation protein Spo0J
MTEPRHDLKDDAPRYVIEALKARAPEWVNFDELVCNYDPPRPNNMAELRGDLAHDVGYSVTNERVKEDLIEEAIHDVNYYNDHKAIEADPDDATNYRLADGVDVEALQWCDNPLFPKPVMAGLFDPETGAFADNIRTPNPEGYKELRESMEALGWVSQFPAIQDENGVVIVGHRRLTVAEELGIEPKISTMTFGDGEAADARRAKVAIASNIGFEKLSPADRKAIAAQMYGSGWSMAKIADALQVATMTVSRDLRGLTGVKPLADLEKRGGRPRKPEADKEAEQQTALTPYQEARQAYEEAEAALTPQERERRAKEAQAFASDVAGQVLAAFTPQLVVGVADVLAEAADDLQKIVANGGVTAEELATLEHALGEFIRELDVVRLSVRESGDES